MEHPVDLSVSLKFEIYKTATKHWLVLFAFLTCQALPAWPASPLPSACAQQATDHEHHLAQVLPESSLVDSRQGLLQPVAAQQRAQRLGHLATAATAPTLPARPPRHALRLQQLRAQLLVRRWVGEDEGQQGVRGQLQQVGGCVVQDQLLEQQLHEVRRHALPVGGGVAAEARQAFGLSLVLELGEACARVCVCAGWGGVSGLTRVGGG